MSATTPPLLQVQWFTMDGADTDKWALVGEVAKALGVSDRALQQWMAPGRATGSHDLTDRLRVVPCADLPPSIRTTRGRSFMHHTAVREYVEEVRGRHGQKRRVDRLPVDQIEQVRALGGPLTFPQVVVVDANTIVFEAFPHRTSAPRGRVVHEWLAPLAARLGYTLVSQQVPPASSPAHPTAAAAPSPPVNVCIVKRRRPKTQDT